MTFVTEYQIRLTKPDFSFQIAFFTLLKISTINHTRRCFALQKASLEDKALRILMYQREKTKKCPKHNKEVKQWYISTNVKSNT